MGNAIKVKRKKVAQKEPLWFQKLLRQGIYKMTGLF